MKKSGAKRLKKAKRRPEYLRLRIMTRRNQRGVFVIHILSTDNILQVGESGIDYMISGIKWYENREENI